MLLKKKPVTTTTTKQKREDLKRNNDIYNLPVSCPFMASEGRRAKERTSGRRNNKLQAHELPFEGGLNLFTLTGENGFYEFVFFKPVLLL